MNEVSRGYQWIRAQLLASSDLVAAAPGGVWAGVAPAGTSAPWVVMTSMASPDVSTQAGIRLWTKATFQVIAYGAASDDATLATLADLIDTQLHRQHGGVSDAYVNSCIRTSALDLDETRADGTLWQRQGGLYVLEIYAL